MVQWMHRFSMVGRMSESEPLNEDCGPLSQFHHVRTTLKHRETVRLRSESTIVHNCVAFPLGGAARGLPVVGGAD